MCSRLHDEMGCHIQTLILLCCKYSENIAFLETTKSNQHATN
uniref:Uncharacterized protein n=1 Tax=Arundo donax TaxID=35708 RepID=A0A0A9A3N3_ARUDO